MVKSSKKCIIIAITGGSGSGKTTFAKKLANNVGIQNCHLIFQDNFYFDQSDQFDEDGGSVNFDHPCALEFKLLAEVLQNLKAGQSIQLPQYDFPTHSRKIETIDLSPKPIIIVDGTLILTQSFLTPLFDETVFLDVAEEIRFQRRIKRDIEERGRTYEGIKKQFELQVKPMHDQFVEPTKKLAKHICATEENIFNVIETLMQRCRGVCH